ncbi:redoxin domain-containing protein [bacterium]|nr:redoxin domain-containing protein [bacterium]MBU1985160.1 redoxin domain-containing protein [bacterium]
MLLSQVALMLLAGWAILLSGCEIEETLPPQTGSVRVTLSDNPDSSDTVRGAAIRVDGRETSRKTPATLTGLSVGLHRISAFKPGFVDTAVTIDVVANRTDTVALITTIANSGSIDFAGAPDGTLLLINNIPVGTVPTAMDPPTLFWGLGLGTFRVSAYLPGHTTEFPAPWTITVSAGEPTALSPVFVSVSEGHEPGDLAPVFDLASDWDSTRYRLQDYRGQVVLVTFFFSNCTGCIEEFPHIQSVYDDPAYEGKVLVLGVDFVDIFRTFARFRDEHPSLGLTFPLLHDAAQSVKTAYGVTTMPANFLIDQKGRVRMARGGVTEPELRQQIAALIGEGQTETFSLDMRETVIGYTNGDSNYDFHATLINRLAVPRSFVFNLVPVEFPETNRLLSLCVGPTCTQPDTGRVAYTAQFYAMQVDSGVKFSIYNIVKDRQTGQTVSSPIVGDYTLDVSVFPADNPSEIITHRLLLDDLSAGSASRFLRPWNGSVAGSAGPMRAR